MATETDSSLMKTSLPFLPSDCLSIITSHLTHLDLTRLWATGDFVLRSKLGVAGGVVNLCVEIKSLAATQGWPGVISYFPKLTSFSLFISTPGIESLEMDLSRLPGSLETLKIDVNVLSASVLMFNPKLLFPKLKRLHLQAKNLEGIVESLYIELLASKLPETLKELVFFTACAQNNLELPLSILLDLPVGLEVLHMPLAFVKEFKEETTLAESLKRLPQLTELRLTSKHASQPYTLQKLLDMPRQQALDQVERMDHDSDGLDELGVHRQAGQLQTLILDVLTAPLHYLDSITALSIRTCFRIEEETIAALPLRLRTLKWDSDDNHRFPINGLHLLPHSLTFVDLNLPLPYQRHSADLIIRLPPNLTELPRKTIAYDEIINKAHLLHLPKLTSLHLSRPTSETVSFIPSSVKHLEITRLGDISLVFELEKLHQAPSPMHLTSLDISGAISLNIHGRYFSDATPLLEHLKLDRIDSLEKLPTSLKSLALGHAGNTRHFGIVGSANGISVTHEKPRKNKATSGMSHLKFSEPPDFHPHMPSLTALSIMNSTVRPAEYVASLPRSLKTLKMGWWLYDVKKENPSLANTQALDPGPIFQYLPPALTSLDLNWLGGAMEHLKAIPCACLIHLRLESYPLVDKVQAVKILPKTLCKLECYPLR